MGGHHNRGPVADWLMQPSTHGYCLQIMGKHSLNSHPVHCRDMEWQDEDSAQIALEMEGMSIKKSCPGFDKQVSSRRRATRSESANVDSMFAWLSKLLPGL